MTKTFLPINRLENKSAVYFEKGIRHGDSGGCGGSGGNGSGSGDDDNDKE